MIMINTIAVENAITDNVYKRSELDDLSTVVLDNKCYFRYNK